MLLMLILFVDIMILLVSFLYHLFFCQSVDYVKLLAIC